MRKIMVIGYLDPRATELISKLEKMPERFFLIPETIWNINMLKTGKLRVGLNGKDITIYPEHKMDILLKYKRNSVFVDFSQNQQKNDFYKKYCIRKILFPTDDMNVQDVIDKISNI